MTTRTLTEQLGEPSAPRCRTILDAISWHARTQGDVTACTYIGPRADRISVTFRELSNRGRCLAAALLRHAHPGQTAILMYPSGLDFIEALLACLHAGIIAVPVYPATRGNADLIHAIIGDAQPTLLLTTSRFRLSSEKVLQPIEAAIPVICTDTIGTVAEARLPEVDAEQLAFIQFTSGSTGKPKGVCVSHANLLSNQRSIQAAFGHTKQSKVVSWLPAFHDMGLVGSTLQPLFVGFPSVFFSPQDFVRQPALWLQTISVERATTSGAPNFAYEYCLDRVPDSWDLEIDLSSWRVAFNGAEPVRSRTLDRFAARFARAGFRKSAFFPCYGMAEATLFVSGGPYEQAAEVTLAQDSRLRNCSSRKVVSCGTAAADTEIRVVCPESLQVLVDGQMGEIWVRGGSISCGYWKRPDTSAGRFGLTAPDGSRNWLRTGDVGFLQNGQLYVTGRSKDVIIVRGRNIHAEDVEDAVAAHLSIDSKFALAAFGIRVAETERIVIVMEVGRTFQRSHVEGHFEAIAECLSDRFSVQPYEVVCVARGSIPRTTSGKVQRSRAMEDYLAGNQEFRFKYRIAHGLRASRDDQTMGNCHVS